MNGRFTSNLRRAYDVIMVEGQNFQFLIFVISFFSSNSFFVYYIFSQMGKREAIWK
jgi:hypothetical protein